MVDVVEVKKAEIWGTFVLAVTLPSNKLRAWDFFTRHLTLMDVTALVIDNELSECEKKSNHENESGQSNANV